MVLTVIEPYGLAADVMPRENASPEILNVYALFSQFLISIMIKQIGMLKTIDSKLLVRSAICATTLKKRYHALLIIGSNIKTIPIFLKDRIIYSLFDYSGNWSEPYLKAGYTVIRIDLKLECDIRLLEIPDYPVYGILSAPPCTHFCQAGSQYWKRKDNEGKTIEGLELIGSTCRFILSCNPHFWVIENPPGRLTRWLGQPKMYFDPCDFGDEYKKKTALWGNFAFPWKKPIPITFEIIPGHHSMDLWLKKQGYTLTDKPTLRSITPKGFAQAFFNANQ